MVKRTALEAAETRRRIKDEAIARFAAQGYASTSITEVAQALGLTDGAVFHHFTSKKVLFAEIVEELHEEVHQAIYDAGKVARSVREAFGISMRASMRITQQPRYQRIVFVDAPWVLGTDNWRTLDAALGLKLIEDGLRHIAMVREMPAQLLRPMAMMTLGTINEITFGLIREDEGLDFEQCLALLDRAIDDWLASDVEPWKAQMAKAKPGKLAARG